MIIIIVKRENIRFSSGNPFLFCSIWESEDCEWVFRASEGSSGGILSIWRKSCASVVSSFQGEGYVRVNLDWGVEKIRCIDINVYSKCDLPAKKRLWDNLIGERQTRGGGVWCVLGDFNVVGWRDERRGVNEEASSTHILEIFLFNSLLGDMELENLKVLGRRFTWYHPNGRSMSRIDRMLISKERDQVWGENVICAFPRDISGHCPLVLKNGGWNWGPSPFRFINFWLQDSDFKGVIDVTTRFSLFSF